MKNRLVITIAAALTITQAQAADKWKVKPKAEQPAAAPTQLVGASKAQEQLEVAQLTAALAKVMAKKETDPESKKQQAELAKKAEQTANATAQAIQNAQAEAKAKQAQLNDPFAKFCPAPKIEHSPLVSPVGGTLQPKKPAKLTSPHTASLKPDTRFNPPAKKPAQAAFGKPSGYLFAANGNGNSDTGDILQAINPGSDSGEGSSNPGAPQYKEKIADIEESEKD